MRALTVLSSTDPASAEPASPPPAPAPESAPKWRRTALLVVASVFFFNLLGRGSGETYAVFLLPLEREFGWSRSQLTSVYALYMLIGGCIAPLVGTLFDRFGPRAVYMTGLSCLAVTNLLASSLSSLWQFYLYIGFTVGLSVALVGMVPASGLLVRWFRERLAGAMGFAFAANGAGVLAFVPLAQLLVDEYGWRMAYRTIGIALLALVPLLGLLLPWRTFTAGDPTLQRAQAAAKAAGEGWTLRAAMRTRFFWGLAVLFTLTSLGMFIVMPQVVAYFIDAGVAPMVAASAYGMSSVMSVISVAVTGFLADRIGGRPVVLVSYVGTGLGIGIIFATSYYPVGWLLACYVIVFGMCQGVRGPIVSALCAKQFAGPQVATIYGVLYAMNAVGAAIGAFIGGVMHDLTGGYRVGFVIAFLAIVCASLPMIFMRELRGER